MNEAGDRPSEPQGRKWVNRAKAAGQRGVERAKGAFTNAGLQVADKRPEDVAIESVDPKEAFVSVATKYLGEVRDRLSRIDDHKELVPQDEDEEKKKGIMLLSTARNARAVAVHLLDCLYPPDFFAKQNAKRFAGIRNLLPEDIGTASDELHRATVKIVKTTVDTMEQTRKIYKDQGKSEEDSWFFGTRDVFFPWHDHVPERGGKVTSEGQSYVSIMDLLDVTPQDIGMSDEQWTEIKVRYFQTWFKNRDNPAYERWGGFSSSDGMVYNHLFPLDIAPAELAGKIESDGSCDEATQEFITKNISEYFDGNNLTSLQAEKFRRHIEKEGRPGHINPQSTSPVWGSTIAKGVGQDPFSHYNTVSPPRLNETNETPQAAIAQDLMI